MLSPKRTKFRKQHRGRMRGKAYRNNKISFGEYALQSQECVWITSRQIEATRRTITRSIKRGGKLWITVFPDKPVTARAAESRMGSGKGTVDYWVAVIKPGTILFELAGVPVNAAQTAMRLASYKLPVKTKFITKENIQ
jgi:large subunit ribosomal protein L16